MVDFNPSLCLRPDAASVAMGQEAAEVIDCMRLKERNRDLPVGVLQVGVATGACLAALGHTVRNPKHISLTGVDIDETAVATAERTVRAMARQTQAAVEAVIFQGDWYDETVWSRLSAQHNYDVILCTPPCLPKETSLARGYEDAPPHTVYAEEGGLEHLRFLLPRLLGLLSLRSGATLLARFPSTRQPGMRGLAMEAEAVLEQAVKEGAADADIALVRRYFALVGPDYNAATVTISRTSGSVPPHLLPGSARAAPGR